MRRRNISKKEEEEEESETLSVTHTLGSIVNHGYVSALVTRLIIFFVFFLSLSLIYPPPQ